MKSPTSSILHSIQSLKSKLKNDHLELQGLRRDFAMYPMKQIIEEQYSQSPVRSQYYKNNISGERNSVNKLAQVRKNHNGEVKKLREEHHREIRQLSEKYQNKIQQIIALYDNKLQEQDSYIHLLEYQLSNIQTPSLPQPHPCTLSLCPQVFEINTIELTFEDNMYFKIFNNKKSEQMINQTSDTQPQMNLCEENRYEIKFQKITNKLLQQNNLLMENLERLKMENRRLKLQKNQNNYREENYSKKVNEQNCRKDIKNKNKQQNQYCSDGLPLIENINTESYRNSCRGKKNRLKFSKGVEDKHKIFSDRSYSSIGSQNIDTSNIVYRDAQSKQKEEKEFSIQKSIVEEQQEQSILEEDFKLKTIKHFMKVISHRSSEAEPHESNYLIPKPMRKCTGNKNELKNVSVL